LIILFSFVALKTLYFTR